MARPTDVALDATVTERNEPRSFFCYRQIMGDEDDRLSFFVQGLESLDDLATILRIQVSRWLVGEYHVGFHEQRSRNRHPLLLTAGQF